MNSRLSPTLKELFAGIGLWGIAVEALLLIFMPDKLFYTLGLAVGLLTACAAAFHMERSIEDALDLGEKHALNHIRRGVGLRMACVMGVFVLLFYTKAGSVLTMFIGVMGLKISAYLQPHIHKAFLRRRGGK